MFRHQANLYASSTYYYLTEDVGTEKLAPKFDELTAQETHTASSFDSFRVYEKEKYNLIKSGKTWFGESFINGTSRNFTFDLTNRVLESPVKVTIKGAARSDVATNLNLKFNNSLDDLIYFTGVATSSTLSNYARERTKEFSYLPESQQLSIRMVYGAASPTDMAWLDYIELNYRQNLVFSGAELFFRDVKSVGEGHITAFSLGGASADLKLFDVTNLTDIFEVPYQLEGNQLIFKRPSGQLCEYVAFNPKGDLPVPEKVGNVDNQNLHEVSSAEMIIIAHPEFIEAANELADFHNSNDGMDVLVVTTNQVYNEFSSGMPDATGIKNYIRMSREKDSQLKYILLFGDGSYDNKNILGGSHNFIPTYQSDNSLVVTDSYVTDDYFVILDEGESVERGTVDLGIGRIPCSSSYEAGIVVEKVKNYHSPEALGDWRNVISFISDDQDDNQPDHMEQSEGLANLVNTKNSAYITNKIYLDAFQQESTSAGEKYPDVTKAINKRVNDGVLILNYVGHANERYLAHENVLDISNINSWTNKNTLPIFVTATCEFSRFDDDEMSAGEHILFNPNGGG